MEQGYKRWRKEYDGSKIDPGLPETPKARKGPRVRPILVMFLTSTATTFLIRPASVFFLRYPATAQLLALRAITNVEDPHSSHQASPERSTQ
jgi:hypothetical protein